MRAVVLDGSPGAVRLVDDWPEPEPGPGEVLVQVRGVGICGSDLAMHEARRRPPAYPWVVGHETYGEIAGTGQRVVIEPNIPCLTCEACRAGRTSTCPRRKSLGFNTPGTLAERVVIPARFAWPVPDEWHDTDAVCAEPFIVARAAIRRARAWSGAERCLVIGAGSQGGLLCLALAADGVTPSVLEPHPGRLALAESLGARHAGPADADFAVIFETSGSAAALGEAVARAARGGLIVLIGQSGQPAELATRTVVQKQLVLMGSLIYDHPHDFAATFSKPDSSRAGTVLRACYPMTEAADAFRAARDVPGKTWIRVAR